MLKRLLLFAALSGAMAHADKLSCPPAISHISVGSGTFAPQPGIEFLLKGFNAALVPMGSTAPSCYEKMTVVSRAVIFVSNESLSKLFAEKLAASASKIKDLKISNGLTSATLSGEMTHIVPIKFSIEGPVTTDGTEIRLDATKIKADGIPVKALLQLLGAELNSILQVKGVGGVHVEDNSLSFAPEQVAHLKGHIASVTTSAQGLTIRYTYAPPHRRQRTPLPSSAPR